MSCPEPNNIDVEPPDDPEVFGSSAIRWDTEWEDSDIDEDEEFDLAYNDNPDDPLDNRDEDITHCDNCSKLLYPDDGPICGICIQEGYYL